MKEDVLALISKGETKKAIDLLLDITKDGPRRFKGDVILISAKYQDHMKTIQRGTSSKEMQGLVLAQVNEALLELVSELTMDSSDQKRAWPIARMILLLLFLVGLGIIILLATTSRGTTKEYASPNKISPAIEEEKFDTIVSTIPPPVRKEKRQPWSFKVTTNHRCLLPLKQALERDPVLKDKMKASRKNSLSVKVDYSMIEKSPRNDLRYYPLDSPLSLLINDSPVFIDDILLQGLPSIGNTESQVKKKLQEELSGILQKPELLKSITLRIKDHVEYTL